MAEHRERGVDAAVEDLVQEVAGALVHELRTHVLAGARALEHRRERQDLVVRQGDDVVRAEEDVELRGVEAP